MGSGRESADKEGGLKIVIILLIANLPFFWGLFYIFFFFFFMFLDTLESAMGWDYGPAGFDSNRIYFFLILCATLLGSEYMAILRYRPHWLQYGPCAMLLI